MTGEPARAAIVIPAFEPSAALVDLAATLSAAGHPLVVVDDGSPERCRELFDRVAGLPQAAVLRHSANRGKGEALKTAFRHVLAHGLARAGVVTADADGQHAADDIERVAAQLARTPSALVLGSRRFDGVVPLRSRIGNAVARAAFAKLLGRTLRDTQTGLRGVPLEGLRECLEMDASGYDFEVEMLARSLASGRAIAEVPIRTIYTHGSPSHFRPLRDTMRVWAALWRASRAPRGTASTDWDRYYRTPGLFTPLTRRVTERAILRAVARAGLEPAAILELGGGDSRFLAALHRRFPSARLAIVDRSDAGARLLRDRLPASAALTVVRRDVFANLDDIDPADLVLSVGLVEHFDEAGTARAIGVHFERVRPGGVVVVTFPTPTWLYRVTRRLAEFTGQWAFPDERPLALTEVGRAVARHGQVLEAWINWPIVLTQGVVVARRAGDGRPPREAS